MSLNIIIENVQDLLEHSNFSERAYDLYYGINEEYAYIKEKYRNEMSQCSVEKVTWELVFINMMICGNKENKKIIQETRHLQEKISTKLYNVHL